MVVIYPYKFNDFLDTLYEPNYFPPYCEVAVWDVSRLVNAKFANAIASAGSQRKHVLQVSKWLELFRQIFKLRHQCNTSHVYIKSLIPNANSGEFFLSLVLKGLLLKTNVTFIERVNPGIPLYYPVASTGGAPSSQQPSKLSKIRMFFTTLSTFTELIIRLQYSFFRALARWLPPATTYRLVAGEHYLVPALRQHPRTAKLVLGHSDDYSGFLIRACNSSSVAPQTTKKAVLLESQGPMFAGDEVQMGKGNFETSTEWYPALTSFLDQLELATGVIVEIAGHYKSAHPATPDYYGNRNVHYGMTQELVRGSELAITRNSTATGIAVLHRKPVIFIYSNQTKANLLEMRECWGTAAFLGTKPVNIDQPPWNFAELLQVNEACYEAYEKACLTSAGPPRPNSQIILEDIMGITVSPWHYNHPTK